PALATIQAAHAREPKAEYDLPHAIVAYVVAVSPQRVRLAGELLNSPAPEVVDGTLAGLRADPALARELITPEWLNDAASSSDPQRRALAARAVGVRGDQGTEVLHRLLHDPDNEAAEAACQAASILRSRAYLDGLVNAIGRACLRSAAVNSLAAYGASICGT